MSAMTTTATVSWHIPYGWKSTAIMRRFGWFFDRQYRQCDFIRHRGIYGDLYGNCYFCCDFGRLFCKIHRDSGPDVGMAARKIASEIWIHVFIKKLMMNWGEL